MSNYIAVALDRSGVAQMSCIAGVGGDVPSLLTVAKSAATIVTLDGCPLKCTQKCLARHNLKAEKSIVLSEYGVKKKYKSDFDLTDANRILGEISDEIKTLL